MSTGRDIEVDPDDPSAQPWIDSPQQSGEWLAMTRGVEAHMRPLCMAARLLPAMTAENAASERRRMVAELSSGGDPLPRWELPAVQLPASGFRVLDALRRAVEPLPFAQLYLDRFDELELDLALLEALGDGRRVRPLSARRFGHGGMALPAPTRCGATTLSQYADAVLAADPPQRGPRVLPAEARRGEPSMVALVRRLATGVGLDVEVRVDPNLVAGAATGDRTVFLADRDFGALEARRLATHEVLGHLVSAANGRAQPLRLLEWGTAGAFGDQEGLSLYMEAVHGLMDSARLRTLAARVVAADMMHRGASFAQTAKRLWREHDFEACEAVAISERAFRGGGVARDVAYLQGFLRVGEAVRSGRATLGELCSGRLSIDALPTVRRLREVGLARRPCFLPRLSDRAFEGFPEPSAAEAAVVPIGPASLCDPRGATQARAAQSDSEYSATAVSP